MPKVPSGVQVSTVQKSYLKKTTRKKRYPKGWIGPAALALLAYAGQLKTAPSLMWIPIDLTVLAAIFTVLAVIVGRLKHGPSSNIIGLPIGLMVLFALGIFTSPLVGYPVDKILTFYTFTALTMLAPFYLLRTNDQRKRFIGMLAAIAGFVALLTAINSGSVSEYTSVSVFQGSDTIGTARMAATGFLICIILAVVAKTTTLKRIALAIAAGGLFLVALSTGSRGPLLAGAIALFAVLITSPGFRRIRGRAILAATALTVGAVYWASRNGGDGAARVLGFLSGERDHSTELRAHFWTTALDHILDTPVGIGWGGFAHLPGLSRYVEGGVLYPHNIILEVFVEGGWLMGLAVVLFMAASLLAARRHSTTPTNTILYALAIFAVVNAMASGDINSNRLMWILLSGVWMLRDLPPTSGRNGGGRRPVGGALRESEVL